MARKLKLNIQLFSDPFVDFKNLPDTSTPLNLTNLNKIQTAVGDILGLDNIKWSSSKTYTKGSVVYYNCKLYVNTTGSYSSTNPQSDTTNWSASSILV